MNFWDFEDEFLWDWDGELKDDEKECEELECDELEDIELQHDDEGFPISFSLEGTHSKLDLWGACHCVFQALEISQDRIVPPEIVALLVEARDCLDRMLFPKTKYAKVGVKFPLSKAKWISKINVCLF